jgi:Secretion system C-terminal sorting domain
MRNLFVLLMLVVTSVNAQVPFSVVLEPVAMSSVPATHSFALAKSGTKWLVIGGRTNGLHGFSTNDNFPVEYANNDVIVIDTVTWTWRSSTLNVFPYSFADPLRSTNMQYVQSGDYLYMTGGFGWDSTVSGYRTFPTLSAIHVDSMISAVWNQSSIVAHVRQIADTNMRVCGGEMIQISGECYLVGGHDFNGRYSDPPIPMFTQKYNHHIRKFSITDDGTNLGITNNTYTTDTTHFHRRDYNLGPMIYPDGAHGFTIYSGVFRKDADLPLYYPITWHPQSGADTTITFQQLQNNYTCGLLPIFDSVHHSMYTVFFGGMSAYYFEDTTQQMRYDSLVPFINDITTVVRDASGNWTQVTMPVTMPGLLGTNMKFVASGNHYYGNGVLNIRELTGPSVVGYLYGGIESLGWHRPAYNASHDTIYRVKLIPDQQALQVGTLNANQAVQVYPNPTTDVLYVSVTADVSVIEVLDNNGRIVMQRRASGVNAVERIAVHQLPTGSYQLRLRSDKKSTTISFIKSVK